VHENRADHDRAICRLVCFEVRFEKTGVGDAVIIQEQQQIATSECYAGIVRGGLSLVLLFNILESTFGRQLG
jgi:hypothetical protein